MIYDKSLNFARAMYGFIALLAFLIRNDWLVLLVVILMTLGTIDIRFNIFYRLHTLFLKNKNKNNGKAIVLKDYGEITFVSGTTAFLLFLGFLIVHFGHGNIVEIGWIYILIVTLLIFLAAFIGFCVATLMYILLKKIFTKKLKQ